jgi:exopolysaccharide biosynthesis polyprenyl glycosylphosphotransferase
MSHLAARDVHRYYRLPLDALLIVAAFALAYWIRYELQWIRMVEPAFLVPFKVYIPSIASLTAILLVMYWGEGVYRQRRGMLFFDEFYLVFRGTILGIATMIVIVFLTMPNFYSRLIFIYTGVIILILLGASRAIERAVVSARYRRGIGVERVLIVGAGEVARSVMRTAVARPDFGYRIVGLVDDDPIKAQTDIGRFPALGTTERLDCLLQGADIDVVISTLPWHSHDKIQQIMGACERHGIQVRIVPDLYQIALGNVVVENLNGIPLLGIRAPVLREWQVVFKRATDILIATAGLLVLLPLLLLIAFAIRMDSPGPVIFSQTRVGKGGKRFTCFKFRSMYVDAEARMAELHQRNEATGPIFKMRHDPRRTRVGRLLRRASLDEVPQLWNVLKGDMSFIGPRPPLPAEVAKYAPWHLRRLDIAPGITGLWQVSGRSDLTFDEMVLLDIYYIENWSPFLDLRILLRSVPAVLFGSGAY